MTDNYNTDAAGKLKISQDVIATIARYATMEVEGVAGLSGIPVSIKKFFISPKLYKAINIEMVDDLAAIDVSVFLKYGAKVQEVARHIQDNVKNAVQNMSGVGVSKVNVHITGIKFDE